MLLPLRRAVRPRGKQDGSRTAGMERVAFDGGSHPAGCCSEELSRGKGVGVAGRLRLGDACAREGEGPIWAQSGLWIYRRIARGTSLIRITTE